jgi:hypothetical protein
MSFNWSVIIPSDRQTTWKRLLALNKILLAFILEKKNRYSKLPLVMWVTWHRISGDFVSGYMEPESSGEMNRGTRKKKNKLLDGESNPGLPRLFVTLMTWQAEIMTTRPSGMVMLGTSKIWIRDKPRFWDEPRWRHFQGPHWSPNLYSSPSPLPPLSL